MKKEYRLKPISQFHNPKGLHYDINIVILLVIKNKRRFQKLKKSIVLKLFSYLAFMISACFSIINLWNMAFNFFAKILSSAMAVVMEYFKVTSLYYAFNEKLNGIIRGGLAFSYIGLVVFSVFFSMNFISNEENANINFSNKHSKQAQAQKEKLKSDADSINRLQSQINDIKSNYEGSIKAKQDYISSLPSDYITAKDNASKEVEGIKEKMATEINNINSRIFEIEKSKKETLSSKLIDEAPEQGFTSLLSTIVTWHNNTELGKESPWTLQQVQFVFYLILSIVFEIIASLLYYLAKHFDDETLLQADTQAPKQIKTTEKQSNYTKIDTKNAAIAESANKIGFTYNNNINSLEESLINKYRNYINKNHSKIGDKKISPGYKSIANAIDIDQETCRKIRSYLEQNGEIRTEGTRTIIL
jgi:hypothetical protein